MNVIAFKMARQLVVEAIKRKGEKLSHFEGSELNKAAKTFLEVHPNFSEEVELWVSYLYKKYSVETIKTGEGK